MKKIDSNPLYRISLIKPQRELIEELFPFRSGYHWLVSEKEKAALLKAPVGLDPIQPPSTGWQFSRKVNFEEAKDSEKTQNISKGGEFEEAPSVVCTNQSDEACSAISVSLRGKTRSRHEDYEGVYKSSNFLSMGRKVSTAHISNPFRYK